ncbi:MAG: hypothetical protein JWO91_554 [Acidobacteriaceae bacterium]|nr:hypothetical protein [Acidobacteriaceae bacterium]
MYRRLEDRVRELCAKLSALRESDPELEPTIKELRTALREHIRKMRGRLVTFPSPERRRSALG